VTAYTADLQSETFRPAAIRLVVDGHEIVRAGLRAILAAEPDLEVVGETGTDDDPLALVAQTQPDVLLLNPQLRARSGPDVCAQLVEHMPRLRILVVSTYAEIDLVKACIAAGAHGYVIKNVGRAELTEAVRAVHGGDVAVSSTTAARVIDQMRTLVRVRTSRTDWRSLTLPTLDPDLDPHHTATVSDLSPLTSREREVLDHLLDGERVHTIADALFVSQSTVRNHLSSIFKKVGVHSQAELLRRLRSSDAPSQVPRSID
jgi:DNA-binding NarL/FixJ family response regulator